MDAYLIALLAGLFAFVACSIASGCAIEVALRHTLSRRARRAWWALSAAALFFAMQQVYALELALKTTLFDLRSALLSALIGALLAGAVLALRGTQEKATA